MRISDSVTCSRIFFTNMFVLVAILFAENNAFVRDSAFHELKEVFFPDKPVNTGNVPEFFDWRLLDKVSPVKNQGSDCKACWAFSANANIESQLKIQLNSDEILSEQFLIDCTHKGCSPTTVLKTFADIVTEFGGVLRNSDYYSYSDGARACRWQSKPGNPSPVPVIGFQRVLPNEEVMAEFVYRYGPLSAGINSEAMKYYNYSNARDSVVDTPSVVDCNPKDLDHAILIVGYGVDINKRTGMELPYWIIKNSWSTQFGDHGYYYLVRGRNACGIASDVSFAIVN